MHSLQTITCALVVGIYSVVGYRSQHNGQTYDYIVIGSGTAGSTVAGQLAANLEDKRILLIEEGYYSVANPDIDDALKVVQLLEDLSIDKEYYTTPQSELNDREIHLARARVTGGCNSHNAQVWILCHEDDLSERWGNINGWNLEDDILPIFDEVEAVAYHGNVNDIEQPMMQRLMNGGLAAGFEYNGDYNDLKNGRSMEGISPVQFEVETIVDYEEETVYEKRRSSWTDFVEPILEAQAQGTRESNLEVLTMTRVDKLLFDDDNDNNRISGVSTYNRGNFETTTFYARHEVIVSAGTYDTPKLLMLSGIGDCDMLENEYNIECHVDVPGVGQNLQDHFTAMLFVSPILNNSDLLPVLEDPLSANEFQWNMYYIAEDARYLIWSGLMLTDADTSTYYLVPILEMMHMESIGNVTLSDSDPASKPIIDHNYLNDIRDQELVVEVLKKHREIIYDSGEFDDGIILSEEYEVMPGFAIQSDEEILAYMRNIVETADHPTGTCKMGNETNFDNDPMLVVNERLQVRGIDNLRVIDASIMPKIVSVNTNAMTMVIGYKGAQMIVEDYWEQENTKASQSSSSSSSSSRKRSGSSDCP